MSVFGGEQPGELYGNYAIINTETNPGENRDDSTRPLYQLLVQSKYLIDNIDAKMLERRCPY